MLLQARSSPPQKAAPQAPPAKAKIKLGIGHSHSCSVAGQQPFQAKGTATRHMQAEESPNGFVQLGPGSSSSKEGAFCPAVQQLALLCMLLPFSNIVVACFAF